MNHVHRCYIVNCFSSTPYIKILAFILFQSMLVLEEVCQMLRALQDATSHDVHCISPACRATLRSIQAEAGISAHSGDDQVSSKVRIRLEHYIFNS